MDSLLFSFSIFPLFSPSSSKNAIFSFTHLLFIFHVFFLLFFFLSFFLSVFFVSPVSQVTWHPCMVGETLAPEWEVTLSAAPPSSVSRSPHQGRWTILLHLHPLGHFLFRNLPFDLTAVLNLCRRCCQRRTTWMTVTDWWGHWNDCGMIRGLRMINSCVHSGCARGTCYVMHKSQQMFAAPFWLMAVVALEKSYYYLRISRIIRA